MRLGKYGIRYGKAFRLRGTGYGTFNISPNGQKPTQEEERFWEIVNTMKPEDAAVIGHIVDPEWYEENEKDIQALEGKL